MEMAPGVALVWVLIDDAAFAIAGLKVGLSTVTTEGLIDMVESCWMREEVRLLEANISHMTKL